MRSSQDAVRQHLPGEAQGLRHDQEKQHGDCPICGIRFLSLIEGDFRHRWIAVWRQEREARPGLINPAISNLDRDTEPTGEIAGRAM